MKATLWLSLVALGLFAGCENAPQMERPQINVPSDRDLIGTYTVLEETITGQPSGGNGLTTSRLELQPGGKATVVDFPDVRGPMFPERYPHKVSGSGTWIVTQGREGYRLVLDINEMPHPVRAVIAENGNPSDLMFYYRPNDANWFIKWRRVQ